MILLTITIGRDEQSKPRASGDDPANAQAASAKDA